MSDRTAVACSLLRSKNMQSELLQGEKTVQASSPYRAVTSSRKGSRLGSHVAKRFGQIEV